MKPVTWSFNGDNIAMVNNPIQNGACKRGVIVKDLNPIFECDIAGQDNAAGFISGAYDLKK
jgi:hypothetical protein